MELQKIKKNIYIVVRNKENLSKLLEVLYELNYCQNHHLWSDYHINICKKRNFLVLELIVEKRIIKSTENLDKDKYTEAQKQNRILVDLDYYKNRTKIKT